MGENLKIYPMYSSVVKYCSIPGVGACMYTAF